MSSFRDLPPEAQVEIRAKQKAKQLKKKNKKKQHSNIQTAAVDTSPFPAIISQDEYFGAAEAGLFRHPQITATEAGIRLIFLNIDSFATYNYFMFSGTNDQVWNPMFNAKLAYEGFFTITHCNRLSPKGSEVPLPELQPY